LQNLKYMKTKAIILVLAGLSWVGSLAAQAPTPPPFAQTPQQPPAQAPAAAPVTSAAQPAAAPAQELEPPLIQKPGAAAAPEIMPLISFDAEYPVMEAVTNLAQQAGITYSFAPEVLNTNGAPAGILTQAVGAVRFENVTARQALDALLTQKSLVLGTRRGGNDVFLGTRESNLVPLEAEGGDLSRLATGDQGQLESIIDPNKEIPLITAIQMLARLAQINVLVDPRIKTGGIRQVGTNIVELPAVATNTISLSTYGGVTPRQMLEAVLNNYGLMLVTDRQTGFYQVTFKDPSAKEPVYTYTIPLRYSNTTNVQTLIQTTFPTAKVQSDTRTAQLVILATEREHDAITNLVASLDTPTKQVLIEARFLETFANPKSIKGIDWTDTFQAQRFTMGNGTLTGSQNTTTKTPGDPVTVTRPDGTQQTFFPQSSTTKTETRNATLSSTAVSLTSAGGFSPNVAFLNAQGVSAVLSFLNSESDSRVLATPRAVTLDNQETRLEVTTAIPIFNATEAIGQAGTAVSSSRPEYTNVGTILIVTPRITGTNVAMKVRPEISRVLTDHPSGRKIVQGKVNEADVFSSSRIETHVMVPSGNTLVMGGLISDSTQKAYTKIPFLGDIPGLGYAFRKESKAREKANLIIFLTPTIIEDSDFQPHRTEFLNTQMPEHEETMPKYYDRGAPYQKVREQEKEQAAKGELTLNH
jgi:Flp pilus assembly secretin CpaC